MQLFSLRNQRAFDLVNSLGKKVSTRYFILIIAKNFASIPVSSDNPAFLGMKVSRRFSKKACVRNKAKRRIRHLMRLMLNDPEVDLVKKAVIFIPYKNFELIKFATLTSELKKALTR